MSDTREIDIKTLIDALDHLGDGFAIHGPDDRPLLMNRVTVERFGKLYDYMKQTGCELREALVYAARRVMPEASDAEVKLAADQLYEGYQSGKPFPAQADNGRLVQITINKMANGLKSAISVDITDAYWREKELRAARKAAEMASQSKSAFLANMSHEIRTPLNGILGMAQVMNTTELTPQQRDFMSTIIESGQILMSLLNDVLDLSKIEAGMFEIDPDDCDIADTLRRIQKLWAVSAEKKGLELTLTVDKSLPEIVRIDEQRLQQCVSNLVSNAIKFTERGRVTVSAAASQLDDGNQLVEIAVSDTGPGMDEETLARLFRPFAQADETISRKHGGTGLGLSITRKLAELMGGSARAESMPGEGSTFVVTFAAGLSDCDGEASRGEASPVSSNPARALKASNLRFLLVDDHPINRQVASLFLRPFGVQVVEAANGKEALGALEKQSFDLVLLDIHMPVMDGPTTFRQIRECREPWCDIPVIAVTADAMSGDKERYLAMGMDGYLAKPIVESELLREINRVCNTQAEVVANIA